MACCRITRPLCSSTPLCSPRSVEVRLDKSQTAILILTETAELRLFPRVWLCCAIASISFAPFAYILLASSNQTAFANMSEPCCDQELVSMVLNIGTVLPANLGTSGVYFVSDTEGRPLSVFKPDTQEHVPEEFSGALTVGENMYR